MRIVAGRLRRRKLDSVPGQSTRPITDRAKEILFENMGGTLNGERVLDVFAGTGTIGLEALSRGAARVVFIENDHRAFQLLRGNVERLGVQDETFCWRTDALRSSFRPRNLPDFTPFDLIFFDPPYRMISGLVPGSPLFKSLERLARTDVSRPAVRLVLRVPRKTPFQMPDVWCPAWNLAISSMEIHVCDRAPVPE